MPNVTTDVPLPTRAAGGLERGSEGHDCAARECGGASPSYSSPYFRSITLHLHHTISVELLARDEPQVAAVRAQLEDAFKQKEQEMRAKIEGVQRSAAH